MKRLAHLLWRDRLPQERRLLATAALLLTLLLAVVAMLELDRRHLRQDRQLAVLTAETRNMLRAQDEIRSLRESPLPAPGPRERTRAALLAAAAARGLDLDIRAEGTGGYVAQGRVAFAAWLEWLALVQTDFRLHPQRVRALGENGQVRVEATLLPGAS